MRLHNKHMVLLAADIPAAPAPPVLEARSAASLAPRTAATAHVQRVRQTFNRNAPIPRAIKVIAVFEILGGICVGIGYVMFLRSGYRFNPKWQAYPGLAFALLATGAGILMWRERRWGVPLSIAVQALQVLSLSLVAHVRYVALAGPLLQFIASTTGVYFELGGGGNFVAVPWSDDGTLGALGASFSVGTGYHPQPLSESTFTVGVNVAAAYCLWRLIAFAAASRKSAHVPGTAPL